MSKTTEEFIRTFEAIVGEVNRRASVPTSHSFEIDAAARRDGTVRKVRDLLLYIRDVRNALQHPKHKAEGHAVHITQPFLAEVQGLLTHLKSPPTAGSVGVARSDIRTAELDDCLGDLAADMQRKGFSHLPIVNERDVVVGVFNEAAVFHHLWAEAETVIGRDMRISDILPHCRLDAGHTETFHFVGPREPLDDLIEKFVALPTPRTRVGAAFVTASGKRTEPLQRLITPWDVLATARN